MIKQPILLKIDQALISIVEPIENGLLDVFIQTYSDCIVLNRDHSPADLLLHDSSDGLTLTWNTEGEKPLLFNINFYKIINQLRSYPAPKQGAFNQALGKKTRRIIDATGGWGGDALLMCTQGYDVTILERNPVMALLLTDAMTRLSRTAWAQDNKVITPKVMAVNAVDYFNSPAVLASENICDCVYLDPMFPPKKKKSAAVNKQMKLLQWMVGEDQDASELVASALRNSVSRIAVKRPDYAQPLHGRPSTQFSSKLVHYDVYLASQS